MHRPILPPSLLAAFTTALLSHAATAAVWSKVAAEGEPSPEGRPYGALVLAGWIADDGAVSFADVPGEPLPNLPVYTLWRAPAEGGVEPIATISAPPGNAGWRRPTLASNRAGDLATLDGRSVSSVDCGASGTSEQAREQLHVAPLGGALALAAATGAAAPGASDRVLARLLPPAFGIPGARFARGPSLLLAESGEPSFAAEVASDPCFLDAPAADFVRALFGPDGLGATAPIALEGEPLPGASEGETLRLEGLALAEAGAGSLLAWTDFDDPGAPSGGSAILRWTPLAGGLETVARSDQPSAWLDGAWLASFSEPRSSPAGKVTLSGVRDDAEPWPLGGRNGIWVGDADGLVETVALAGPVPGGPVGAEFLPMPFAGLAPLVNDAGELAFVAPFLPAPAADAASGLFAPGADGSPTLRLASGTTAPGAAPLGLAAMTPLHLAPSGDVLLFALIDDEPFPSEDAERAWYLVPRSGPPRLLLRESGAVELAPGDVRALEGARVAHDAALTRLAVHVGASGTTPTAIATRAVPEPCAAAAHACALAACALLASRRRARMPIHGGCRSDLRPRS